MTTQLVPADAEFLSRLRAACPGLQLRAPDPRYLEEPRGNFHGRAAAVALPASTDEVAACVRVCAAERVGIVPWSGGTGLVGGQVKPDPPEPLVVSLERMDRVRAVWAEEFVLVAEAGAVLADVREVASAAGRLFPLSLASEGSARIGGLLSTNAGGVNVLRWGTARELCLGIEAVLPDGRVMHGLKRLRKDNTGYDLRNLLCGAEGTLGIITAAALKLVAPPRSTGVALLGVGGPAEALELLAIMREEVGEAVSAFELIHRTGLEFLARHLPQVRQPLARPPEWMVLAELGLAGGAGAEDALEAIYARALELGLVGEGVIAASERQRRELWALRETIPEANRLVGPIASTDIALPLSEIAGFVVEARKALAALGPLRINCFGHLGDGNLHFNIFPPEGGEAGAFRQLREPVMRLVHDLVAARGGTFSAEHGIGRLKVDELSRLGDPARLGAMRAVKAALDPAGIMNPGAVLGPA